MRDVDPRQGRRGSEDAERTIQRLNPPEELRRDDPLFWSPGAGTAVWEMFCAAIRGDVTRLRSLVAADPSLARCHYRYHTPLAFAVRANQLEAASYLFDLRPPLLGDPREMARDRGYSGMEQLIQAKLADLGVSPRAEQVAEAIRGRDLPMVRQLLADSPDLVHACDERTNQPIHWAVMTRQPAMIDELVARGANLDAKRFDGARPIQLANGDYCYRGRRDVPDGAPAAPREVIAHLRSRGASCDICTAAYIGDLERVRELLSIDPSLANRPSEYITYYACSGTPLRNAAAGGHMAIVELLLAHGADPNLPEEHIAPRGHALHAAVCNGHVKIVELLLERGAYPNVEIESSADTLSAAMRAGNEALVELLCAHGAASPLHLLAYHGDARVAAAIFAANPASADDVEALRNAAEQGHEAFVRLMLRYRPGLPARLAAAGRTRALTELLFAHGMDPNRRDWLGETALHGLAARGDVESAALFVDRGADLNAREENFRSTPLGWAARTGQAAMVEFLVQRGASARLPDDPPWATPLAWATRRGHRAVVELLRRDGAE